jgi:hypothetical protein
MTHVLPLLTILLIRIIYETGVNAGPLIRRLKMKLFSLRRKAPCADLLFNGHYVDIKVLYVQQNRMVPCICYIGEMDIDKAFIFIKDHFKDQITDVYQHYFYDHEKKNNFFNNSIFVLKNNRMIELQQNFCQVLHSRGDYKWANQLVNDLVQFRIVQVAPVHTKIIGFAKQTEMN